MAQRCVSIREDQDKFIDNQRRGFNLSKFVQAKLDEYINAIKEYKQFMEVDDEKKIE